jgi:hypothetical protein
VLELSEMLAGSTGLEPAASGVTGRRSNQLNYDPEKLTIYNDERRNVPSIHPVNSEWAVQGSNL